jgi:cytochrome c oxidase subunit 4
MSLEPTDVHVDHDHASMTKKKIWQVFFILLALTVLEFFIALYMVPNALMPHSWANPIYIILTLAKAFYIVAYFMHLKFEKVGLIYSIAIPTLFIIGLILVLTNESHYWFDVRF